MRITVYPNCEIRARVPAPVPMSRHRREKKLLLVNRVKLAIPDFLTPADCVYPHCPWPRPGYGGMPKRRRFSLRARQTLARAGGVFSEPDCDRIVFLTGTLPGGTEAAVSALSANSSWVVHQLMTRIPRLLGVLPSELRWMWVWEHQERGALHWHCVLECLTVQQKDVLLEAFRRIWCAVIDGLSRRSGVDCAERLDGGTWAGQYDVWRIDAQVAVFEPYRYLAKYLSKGYAGLASDSAPPPTRWYGCSRLILEELRNNTIVVETPHSAAEPGWVLTDDDVMVLRMLSRDSEYEIAFQDKFREGSTVVFYLGKGKIREVMDFLLEIKSMGGIDSNVRPGPLPVKAKKSPYFVWADVDRCLLNPVLASRLYADIGSYYRKQLDLYRSGKESVWGDMYWVDRHAAYLLYLTSGRPGVNSGAPPLGGLTPDALRKLGKESGRELTGLIPGLPF